MCDEIYIPPEGEAPINLLLSLIGTLSLLSYFFLLSQGYSMMHAISAFFPFLGAYLLFKVFPRY